MKTKEYMRLGKISIKSRKKSTKNTVRGICFGLIMLIPVVFFTFSFYIGMTSEINKTETISSFHVYSRNVRDDGPSISQKLKVSGDYQYYDGYAILNFKSTDDILNSDLVTEKIYSEYYSINAIDEYNKSGSTSFSIDGTSYSFNNDYSNNSGQWINQPNYGRIKVSNLGMSNNKYILDSEIEDFKKVTGNDKIISYGTGFTSNTGGKTEVIISENLLSKLSIADNVETVPKPQDVIGKRLSIKAKPQRFSSSNSQFTLLEKDEQITNDNNNNNQSISLDIMSDFKIVGVVSSNYYKLPNSIDEGHIWITENSLYVDENRQVVAPTYEFISSESENESNTVNIRYDEGFKEMGARAKSLGVVMLSYGAIFGNAYNEYSYRINAMDSDNFTLVSPMDIKIQTKNYKDATKLSSLLNVEFKKILPDTESMMMPSLYANETYVNFTMINMIGTYVMLILYVFGGIIFFATMLNLYNSINYSVEARRNYMGVMRAIGAKQKVIPKLYFFEIILIFLRALPWVLVISGGMSYGIKYLVDMLFNKIGTVLLINITLNFWFYFLTLAVVGVLVFLIALAFSQIASYRAAHKPILDVLSDDKG